jgi:hypothetical protein
MPTVITEGAMAARGFGFGASSAAANYIEDVFSTYLYTGNGTSQTITNGIDLSTKGGLVWSKSRSAATNNGLVDSARTPDYLLRSNQTTAQISLSGNSLSPYVFNTNGFTTTNYSDYATNGATYVSWTFRKQTKFFDIVTYTGTGANRTIAHNLGSTPGCIIVKRTDSAGDWQVYHNGLTSAAYSIQLNLTNAQASATTVWNSTAPTSSVFSVGTDTTVNASGGTYVAYLFASNAGGFGAAGTDNVITCGSFTATGNDNVTLGYEPQWVLAKSATLTANWILFDNMRGMPVSANSYTLVPNTSAAETNTAVQGLTPTATGFNNKWFGAPSGTMIYIAIRRGPMKTPTSGTSVFSPVVRTGTSSVVTVSTTVTPDFYLCKDLANAYGVNYFDRLRGASATGTPMLNTPSTGAETTPANTVNAFQNTSVILGTNGNNNFSGNSFGNFFFSRAPGFFDEVCYAGNGDGSTITQNVNHNLGVIPELVIVKCRNAAKQWTVYSATTGTSNYLSVNSTSASATQTDLWNGAPTSTLLKLGIDSNGWVNAATLNYVAYLFASCPGVSKVGAYTGTGATQTIDCGFTGGARFVIIKRTDSTGEWYMFDSADGFTSSSSPYILLSSTAAQTTGNNGCYATSVGFTTTSTANATVNISGASYIFLAIA